MRDRLAQPLTSAPADAIMGSMELFGTLLIACVVVAIIASCLSFIGVGRIYASLGRAGGIDRPEDRRERRSSSEIRADMDAEIRQMLQAKSDRRERRGQPPLDIEAELAELMDPTAMADTDLREEVRQVVVARNERRVRRGEQPLEIEAEIDRQLSEIGA